MMGGGLTDRLDAEVWELYDRWFAAIPGDDKSFFERVLADDFYYTNYYGEVRGKADYLELIARGNLGGALGALLWRHRRPRHRFGVG